MIRHLPICYILFLVSCSTTSEKRLNNLSTAMIRTDTIVFGSYYNTSFTSEIGDISFENEKDQEITHFKNDTIYKVTVRLSGKNKVPFKLISLNSNVIINPDENERAQYWFEVSRKSNDSIRVGAKKVRADAQFALLSDSESIRYYIKHRYWIDSTKTKYEEYTLKLDTIHTYSLSIKDQ